MLYRKLDVWQRSRLLSISVYREMDTCRDYGFKDQITRSALSVPSNIAEGCERKSLKERQRFFAIAKG
ncbi:four helix bundle protein [Vibrio fortis]